MAKIEPKVEKKQKFEKAKIFTFDINTNEISNEELDLDTRYSSFDLNSADLFNPDVDCRIVAKKCWNWLLNPISLEKF